MLMNRIGRKNTVLLSLLVTLASLLMPLIDESFTVMLVAFSLLGIGNALMQTSLNPLISSIISGKHLASTLTFGQFIKAIASFLAPYLAMWGATAAMPSFGCGGHCGDTAAVGYTDRRGRTAGQRVGFRRLPATARQTGSAAVVCRNNVSCGH